MDERKAQLKMLKKAYNRDKRKCVTLWKTLAIVFMVLTLLSGAVAVLLSAADNVVARQLRQILPQLPHMKENEGFLGLVHQVGSCVGLEITMAGGELFWVTVFALASLVCLVLLIVALPLWGRGARKFKKTRGYLDYQTMKRAVKELV